MELQTFTYQFEQKLADEIERTGEHLSIPAGELVVKPGKYIKVIPLLISGTIKVMRVDSNNNELFLYHITKGQSCAVSLSTCLNQKLSSIKAVTEADTELIAISAVNAMKWFNEYASWRKFVVMTMDIRFEELIHTIDSVAFQHVNERLVALLANKSRLLETPVLIIKHQDIADELSTSREVISRLLKKMEQAGKLKLYRNRIVLLAHL